VLPPADGAEISACDAASQRLFVTGDSLHIVDMVDPQNPAEIGTVPIGDTTSVAVSNGLVAAAIGRPGRSVRGQNKETPPGA
jgi:hypothetical protein